MSFEDYTLFSIRTRLQEEFAIDTADTATATIIDKRINDAAAWIVRRRPNWPWMRKRFVIDTNAPTTGVGDVLNSSRTISNVSFTALVRRFLTLEDAGDTPTTGHMVTAESSGTVTIDQQFLGTTLVGDAIRMVDGMFQLPDDFVRLEGPPLLIGSDTIAEEMRLMDPERFQRKEYRNTPAVLNYLNYAVERDPLEGASFEDNKYLRIFPYLAEANVIRTSYYRDLPVLSADTDITLVPRSDRPTLFLAAAWFVAQWKGAETSQFYQGQAVEALERMAQEYELTDDASEFEAGYEPDFIMPPTTYQDFDRSY